MQRRNWRSCLARLISSKSLARSRKLHASRVTGSCATLRQRRVARRLAEQAPRAETDMEVFDAVRTILAVRSYRAQPVAESAVLRILEAGRLTASEKNAQPWHFSVVTDRSTLAQLGALVPTGPYIAQAALAIVVAVHRT